MESPGRKRRELRRQILSWPASRSRSLRDARPGMRLRSSHLAVPVPELTRHPKIASLIHGWLLTRGLQ